MVSSVAKTFAKIKAQSKKARDAYASTTQASLNKYGKVVQSSFQAGLVSRANLIKTRTAREELQQRYRADFTAATSNVLSDKTLDFLREQSNISAPTLTSIFTGYEMARADRAGRFEKLLDTREAGMERIQSAEEMAFKQESLDRVENIRQQGNILSTGIAANNVLYKSTQTQYGQELTVATAEFKATEQREVAKDNQDAAIELQKQRDKLALERMTENNKKALARMDKEIAARQTAAKLANEKAVALQKQADAKAEERAKSRATAAAELEKTKQTAAAKLEETKQTGAIAEITERGKQQRKTDAAKPEKSTAVKPVNPVTAMLLKQRKDALSGGAESSEIGVGTVLAAPKQTVPTDPTKVTPVNELEAEKKVGDVVPTIDPETGLGVDRVDGNTGIVKEPTALITPETPEPVQVATLTPEQTEEVVEQARLELTEIARLTNPDAVTNLGEAFTFADIRGVVDENNEEVAEILSRLPQFNPVVNV